MLTLEVNPRWSAASRPNREVASGTPSIEGLMQLALKIIYGNIM
jgi:hypothetical protein